jgi:hypothetical protein
LVIGLYFNYAYTHVKRNARCLDFVLSTIHVQLRHRCNYARRIFRLARIVAPMSTLNRLNCQHTEPGIAERDQDTIVGGQFLDVGRIVVGREPPAHLERHVALVHNTSDGDKVVDIDLFLAERERNDLWQHFIYKFNIPISLIIFIIGSMYIVKFVGASKRSV